MLHVNIVPLRTSLVILKIPPALVELANIRTRSLTIFFALARLFPPGVTETPMFRAGHLELHVAGADWSEGRSVDQTVGASSIHPL